MSKDKPTYNEIVFSDDQINKIIDMYKIEKISTVKIGKIMGCNYNKINKILKENHVPITNNGRRKYKLNETYFDSIDTPNKAYILGFLYADGNVYPDKQTIFMSLQEDDYEILEKIRIEIGSEKPLGFIDNTNNHRNGFNYKNAYILKMYSKHMCDSLINIGMIPNKSLKLEYPNIPKELNRHFIRGYFDGDGCITRYIVNENNHQVSSNITSTKSFCERIQKMIKDELNINSGVYDASNHNGITKVLSMGKRSTYTFLSWLYDGADLYMKRKHDRFIEYFKIA